MVGMPDCGLSAKGSASSSKSAGVRTQLIFRVLVAAIALMAIHSTPSMARDKLQEWLKEVLNPKESWPPDYSSPKFRRKVQQDLDALGFDVGEIDGVFGQTTLSAIKAWQIRQGHPGDGKLTRGQAQELHQMAAAAPKRPPVVPVALYVIVSDNLGASPVREIVIRCARGGEFTFTQLSDRRWSSPLRVIGDFHELASLSCR